MRERRLKEAYELIVRVMALRPPQAVALRRILEQLLALPRPLRDCTPDELGQFLAGAEGQFRHEAHPVFTLALATGVGKTRLAGAIIALLHLAREASTFLILAPRTAVLRRFSDALSPTFREYLFVDAALVPEPLVVTSDLIDTSVAVGEQLDVFDGPRIYLLSPQLISTSDRFLEATEHSGRAPAEYLRDDVAGLVVLADEAHHFGGLGAKEAARWADAVRAIAPSLQVGLTATPRNEPGENLLYNYSLADALREGYYTKKVHLLVRDFARTSIDPEEVDRATIDFALRRLDAKCVAAGRSGIAGMEEVKPVCVFFARDIAHAEWVVEELVDGHRFGPEEILVTHSRASKSEEQIERLLSIEEPHNPVRCVVNVQELTEGWDVRNVYVVAPLRAMATFQGALQSMGRGLRLPLGERVGNDEVDSLDVVCFGKSTLQEIVEEATTWMGDDPSSSRNLIIDSHEAESLGTVLLRAEPKVEVQLTLRELEEQRVELKVEVPPQALGEVARMMVEGLELTRARATFGVSEIVRLDRDDFVEAATVRALRTASRYLSDDEHFGVVEQIVEDWLEHVDQTDASVDFDPAEVGEEIGNLIVTGATRRTTEYHGTGSDSTITFGPIEVPFSRPIASGQPASEPTLEDIAVADPESFVPGQYYRGFRGRDWAKSVHAAYSFDSLPEITLADLLDRSDTVEYWVRNQPRRVRIPTPAGLHSPDFIMKDGEGRLWLVEVKGSFYWNPPDSIDRVKASCAANWAKTQSELSDLEVSYRVALDTTVLRAGSWETLVPQLLAGGA